MSDDAPNPSDDAPEPLAVDPSPDVDPAPFAQPLDPDPQPTPVVEPAEASPWTPPGTALPSGGYGDDAAATSSSRPELKVAGAFAGGLAAALILKRLGS